MKKVLTVLVAVLMFATSAMAQQNMRPSNKKFNPATAQQNLRRAFNNLAPKADKQTFHAPSFLSASKATHDLEIASIGGTYYPEDNDWFIAITATDGYQYTFDIVADVVEAGTVYNLTDMMGDYTGQRSGYDYSWNATAATFTTTSNLVLNNDYSIGFPGNVTASLTSPSGDIYNMTFSAPTRPDHFDDVTATCDLVILDNNTGDPQSPYFMFTGMNDTLVAQVSFNVNTLAGTYYFFDNTYDPEYSSLTVNGEPVAYDSLRLEVTATANPDEYDATLLIGAFNGIHYTITMNYRVPTAQTTQTVTMDNLTIDNSMAAYGIYVGTAESDNYAIQFYAFGEGMPIDANNVSFYAYNALYDDWEQVYVYSSDLVYNSNTSVTGSLLCYNNVLYNITLTGSGAMQYDETESDFEASFAQNEVEVITDYADQGMIVVRADNGSEVTMIEFFVESGATVIPAGTYTIDDSQFEGTVMASPGVSGGSVYPSFAGLQSPQGITNVWFYETGSVTVTNNSIEVNAVNSANRTITITMPYAGGVGINEVENTSVSIYPNPATSVVNVNAEGLKEVSVLDLNGRVIMTQNNSTIDMSNLSNGTYMVRVITNNGTSYQKVVKK